MNTSLVAQKDSAVRPGLFGESLDFFSLSKNLPPLGGVNPKKYFEVTHRAKGCPMPNLAEIHPVVWAPNPIKQTDRQTDTSLLYAYIHVDNRYLETSFLCLTTSSTDSLSLQMDTVAREAAREARSTAAKARRLELGMEGGFISLVG